MTKIAVVTDSTAYIPKNLMQQYNIQVVPNIVIWGGKSFRDGVDMQPSEFFDRLKVDAEHPTTSVASLGDMQEVYSKALAGMEGVVGMHVSGKLSNTFKIAQEAANMVNGSAIRIVDSEVTSMALGFVVLAAARAAADGKSLAEVAQVAQNAVPHVGVVLTVETLKYLQRGGRIGAAQAFVGGLLDMKPVLEVRDGVVQPLERVRSKKKAAARLVDLVTTRLAGKSNIRLAAIHASAEGEAREILEAAKAKLGSAVVEALVADVSPTVAVHTGPGTIGLAYSEGI